MLNIDLTLGGQYTGTPEQCLTLLRRHPDLVRDKDQLLKDFHWSINREQWVYIKDMHPAYIRHVLLQELDVHKTLEGYRFIKHALSTVDCNYTTLVGQMVSLWYKMYNVPHDHKRELMLAVLQGAVSHDPLGDVSNAVSQPNFLGNTDTKHPSYGGIALL